MAQIFVSHSSRDKLLIGKFVDLLETGLGVHGKGTIFASSIPGKDIEMGNVNSVVKEKLTGAELAIFILSHNFYESPYCMAEMGAAWATDKQTFILTAPSLTKKDVKAVFEGQQIEQLQVSRSLDKLADVIVGNGIEHDSPGMPRWNEKRDEFVGWLTSEYEDTATSRVEDLPEWRDRGHWSASIADGTLYIGSSGYVNVNVKSKIHDTIEQDLVLPTVYAYMTNTGFHNWLRLAEDHSYRYYRDSLDLLSENDSVLAEKIKDVVDKDEIDLISLGPGDGAKDVVMLRALAKQFRSSDLYYYPFDVNPSMISRAMKTAGDVRGLKKIQVKAILADFGSLPQFSKIYQYRKAPNVLTLLGNTLGNLSDDRVFLEQIHSGAMSKGDLLLLEVRKSQESAANLRTEANKEFDFGPLELLGVPFEPKKLHYTSPKKRYSLVPNTSTILATYDEITYEGTKYEDVKLALIHEYDPDALKSTCEDIGFTVVSHDEHRSAAALLLQK